MFIMGAYPVEILLVTGKEGRPYTHLRIKIVLKRFILLGIMFYKNAVKSATIKALRAIDFFIKYRIQNFTFM